MAYLRISDELTQVTIFTPELCKNASAAALFHFFFLLS